MGVAAAALAWRPLLRVVIARAHLVAVILSVAATIVGSQYAQTSALAAKVDKLDAKVDAKFDQLDAKVDAKFDQLSADVRAGMRRVDTFAEAAAKAQLLWDAAPVKVASTATPLARSG